MIVMSFYVAGIFAYRMNPVREDVTLDGGIVIYKVRTNKKYPFKQMKLGEAFRLNEQDVRGAQKIAHYYRMRCKRPIGIVIIKTEDAYFCKRVK